MLFWTIKIEADEHVPQILKARAACCVRMATLAPSRGTGNCLRSWLKIRICETFGDAFGLQCGGECGRCSRFPQGWNVVNKDPLLPALIVGSVTKVLRGWALVHSLTVFMSLVTQPLHQSTRAGGHRTLHCYRVPCGL